MKTYESTKWTSELFQGATLELGNTTSQGAGMIKAECGAEAEASRLQSRVSGVCCCCLLEGTFGTMEHSYCWGGYKQTYRDMLLDMFGIIFIQDHGDPLICGVCEIRLRQAFTFWRQVRKSKKKFTNVRPAYKDHSRSIVNTSVKEFIEVESETVVPDTDSEDNINMFDDDVPSSTITQADTSSDNADGIQSELDETTINNGETEKHTQKPKCEAQLILKSNLSDETVFKIKHDNMLNYTTLNCIFCYKLFESQSDFTCHTRTCELRSKKILPKKCCFCPTTFEADAILISKHMWTEHRYRTEQFKELWLKCDICSAHFRNIMTKVKHVRRSHHTCNYCRKVFLNMYEKNEHELSHPLPTSNLAKPVSRSAQCPECKEVFASVKLCQVHVHRNHGSKCGECKERFIGVNAMFQHKVEAHGKPMWNCGACDNSYYNEYRLKMHQRMHHMQEKNISCPKCDYVAFNKSRLNKHMIRHTKDKAFVCPYCSKRFSRTTTLNFHKRIHTGDKRQVCKVCGQAFVQRASLKYHLEKYHPGEL